jgi:hypothetical protein
MGCLSETSMKFGRNSTTEKPESYRQRLHVLLECSLPRGIPSAARGTDAGQFGHMNRALTQHTEEVEIADQTALPLLTGVPFVQGTVACVRSSYTKSH